MTNELIDLAPNHKLGLVVTNCVLLGAGAIGYGEAIPKGLDVSRLGAAVVGPVLGASRGGAQPPRLAHVNGGIVLETGLQNRGVNNAIQQHGKRWSLLGCPVVVQVAESHPATLAKVVAKLALVAGVEGLELLPAPDIDAARLATLLHSAQRACELPLWVKLPPATAVSLAAAACEAGAVGLVLGQSPVGSALVARPGADAVAMTGLMYGPLLFPQVLTALSAVAAQQLPAALIACGGIHTVSQVRQALAAGARAVQIDSAVWVEPGLPARLAQGLE